MKQVFIEGVQYFPFLVKFTLADGRRRVWTRWSPGRPWVSEEVSRELNDRFTERELPRSSKVVIQAL